MTLDGVMTGIFAIGVALFFFMIVVSKSDTENIEDITKDFKVVCIDGFKFYGHDLGGKGGLLVHKLDEDGHPVHCK